MAFVDTLLTLSDADVVMVDRRHRPGGHWIDAYPFVRIHQTSATYGVPSRRLGQDRIDETGPNAGFYERATAAAICDYYTEVLEKGFERSGRVRFLPMCDYEGEDADGHHVVSLLSGSKDHNHGPASPRRRHLRRVDHPVEARPAVQRRRRRPTHSTQRPRRP